MRRLLNSGKIWLLFGSICLLISGLLTAPMLLGKIAYIRDLLPGVEWVRRSLAVHVILATIIWHSVVPIGLLFIAGFSTAKARPSFSEVISLSLILSGMLLLFGGLFDATAEPILANYIPVITRPYFYYGIILILTGLTLGMFVASVQLVVNRRHCNNNEWQHLNGLLLLGVLFFLLGILALLSSHYSLAGQIFKSASEYFELAMWGGGHLFQHSASVFLVVAWEFLLLQRAGTTGLTTKQLKIVSLAFAWPILFLPSILINYPSSPEYRQGFTWLMTWGIFPAIIIYLAMLATRFKHNRQKPSLLFSDFKDLALLGSVFLIFLGIVFGAFIEGSDLRVPGHYHASIGAITIAFMAVCIAVLQAGTADTSKWSDKLMCYCVLVYVFGQTLFSGAMFAAGCFGVERKTYGSGLIIETTAQKISFAVLGIGGTIAFLGGLLFSFVFLSVLFNYHREVASQ